MEEQFKIKSYGYGELALLYFPNSTKKSASVQLRRWLKQSESLKKQLIDTGFKSGQKLLTPKQVNILVTFLGAP